MIELENRIIKFEMVVYAFLLMILSEVTSSHAVEVLSSILAALTILLYIGFTIACWIDKKKEKKPISNCYNEIVNDNPFVDKLVSNIEDRLKEVYGEELPKPLNNQIKYIVSQTYQATEEFINGKDK